MPRSMGYGILKFKVGAVNVLFFISLPSSMVITVERNLVKWGVEEILFGWKLWSMAYLDPARL